MRITLDLPDYDADWHTGSHPEGPDDSGTCSHCNQTLNGTAVKLNGIGWLHSEPCLQQVIDSRINNPHMDAQSAYITAWCTVAEHVAKYPSRHNAATIRAVICNLGQIVGWKPRS